MQEVDLDWEYDSEEEFNFYAIKPTVSPVFKIIPASQDWPHGSMVETIPTGHNNGFKIFAQCFFFFLTYNWLLFILIF